MVEEPEVDRHHIVDEDKVAHLAAGCIAAIRAEQLDPAFLEELVVLVKGHAGHAALVLLARAVDVEVAKADHLGAGLREVRADFAAQALVEQQLGVAVYIERLFAVGALPELAGAAIGGSRGGIQQAHALLLAGLEQVAGQAVVVVHHVLAVALHGVAARAFMEHRLDGPISAFSEELIKVVGVYVVGDLQVGQVAEFIALGQVVDRDDLADAARIEPAHDVAAYEAGCAGDDHGHKGFSCAANSSG